MGLVNLPADLVRTIRDLKSRVAALERRASRPTGPVAWAVGTGDTGILGGAWQQVPGLSVTVSLRAGQRVSLDAAVLVQAGNGDTYAFWRVQPPTGAEDWPSDRVDGIKGGPAGSRATVAALGRYTAAQSGDHTFRILCTSPSGGGYGVGVSGKSAIRVTAH